VNGGSFDCYSDARIDYSTWIHPCAEAVVKGEAECGIVLGGSG
jgi:ribose 5-phosphate isomerase B